nr:glycosyltransferase family 4 protein [uncultured Sphingomonas sp.]
MIRAAHLLPHDGIGGVEVAATSMARETDPDHFRLFFIAGDTALDEAHAWTGSFRSPMNPLGWVAAARNVAAYRPDVLIFSLWKSVPAALLAKLMRPQMRLAYTLNLAQSPHLLDRAATFIALLAADEAWSDSNATETNRKPAWIMGRRLSLIQPGRQISASPARTPAFVSWCRLHPQKGLDRAIDLIARLRAKGFAATYDVYGPDNGAGPALKAQAALLGLSDHVRFHPPVHQDELAAMASSYSFFLLPSRAEGMALATVESMQFGLVPVVTAVGEMAHYVRHLDNGIIIDPDRTDDCLLAIERALGAQDVYDRLRDAAVAEWQNAPTYRQSVEAAIDAIARRDSPQRRKR